MDPNPGVDSIALYSKILITSLYIVLASPPYVPNQCGTSRTSRQPLLTPFWPHWNTAKLLSPSFRVYSLILQCGPSDDLSFISAYYLQFPALPHHLIHYLFPVPVSNLALPHSGISHVSSSSLEHGELYDVQPILNKNLKNLQIYNYPLLSPSSHPRCHPHLQFNLSLLTLLYLYLSLAMSWRGIS